MSLWVGDSQSLQIYNRLAAYEDTGLMPEEIGKCPCDAKQEVIELYEIVEGISRDRLRKICEAEHDGRLVVLPCKVGEIVYVPTSQVCDDCIISGVIQYFVVYETFTDAAAIFNQGSSDAFIARVKTENIGKTVFLTREEAEAALKERGEKHD